MNESTSSAPNPLPNLLIDVPLPAPIQPAPPLENSAQRPDFPRAVLSYSREELTELALTIQVKVQDADGQTCYVEGTLPDDLQGHVFIASPVGCVESYRIPESTADVVLPSHDGWTNLLNGDGMIYRIDFHHTPTQSEAGKGWLSTRLVKPPAFYADKITYGDGSPNASDASSPSNFWQLRFWNLGIARFSLQLGMCNQVNTGLQFVKFKEDSSDRLIITNDASRPYQLDPCSLKTIAPVGLNRYWEPMLNTPFAPAFALPGVMSAAHPCFDPHPPGDNPPELLTVNVQRSAKTTLRLPIAWRKNGQRAVWRGLWELFIELLIQGFEIALDILDRLGLAGYNALYLARWQGGSELQKWQVVLPNGARVKIRQSSHMMGLTRNYVVLADTAFKLAPKDMFPGALIRPLQRWMRKVRETDNLSEKLETTSTILDKELAWLESRLTYPQSPDTYLYVVARSQLDTVPPGSPIQAQRITVEGEFAHFLTDYEETPDGRIILHPAMSYASDPAEFLTKVDTPVYADPDVQKAMSQMVGMWAAPTDVNSPAVIAIDPTGKKPTQKYELDILDALQFTLFLGLYAYSDALPTGQFEDIYWSAGATDPKLFTQEIYDLYKNYKYRRLSISEIQEHLRQPTPMFVLRAHIDRDRLLQALASDQEPAQPILQIADYYEMPAGYIANSPQFIPRNGVSGAKEGYLLCVVTHSDRFLSEASKPVDSTSGDRSWSDKTELWVFDARDLAAGALYKLSHAQLNMGLSLHTTWIHAIASPPPNAYSVAEDYKALVAEAIAAHSPSVGDQIRQLFDQIYQQFNAAK